MMCVCAEKYPCQLLVSTENRAIEYVQKLGLCIRINFDERKFKYLFAESKRYVTQALHIRQ
jgi:hypothetical protein